MNEPAVWWDFDPATIRGEYVWSVLEMYAQTPTFTGRVRREDRRLAHRLYQSKIPLRLVEASISLAAVRRIYRPLDAAPLSPARSLHYILPILDEIRQRAIDPEYLDYVEWKVRNADRELERARVILARRHPSTFR